MGIFPADPKGHKPSHGKTGDCPVFPVSDCMVMGIYIINKLGEIDRKLTVGIQPFYVVGMLKIIFIFTPVISVRFNDNNIMGGYKIRDVIALVFITLIIISLFAGTSEIPLSPPVIKIDDRVFLIRMDVIIRRQEYTVISYLSKYLAIVS